MGGFIMWNRRDFLKNIGLAGLFLGTGVLPKSATAAKKELQKITILHTNDLHSRIEPFPKEDPNYSGLGGFARIHALVQKIRKEEELVLLFDAGDVFQGTPYFNFFKGEAEFKLMSKIGYDAGTLGNHEFDNGVEGIASQMKHLNFPLLNANYNFTGTELEGQIPAYKIFDKGDLKIGIFGLGVNLDGYVEPKNRGAISYIDPVIVTEKMVNILKNENACDLVICLSHMGLKSFTDGDGDLDLAKQTRGIDLIIGGHTHTLMETPERVLNLDGDEVLINQVGWAGIALGRIDFYIDKKNNTKLAASKLIQVAENLA
ncbi:metallophosphatase [Labilibaculum filiforme]|uniref:Metallophosphatase n=2 Tax=Labilibaculum filiforme TaxID=1940526 RepID=A0A2N3I439_9BACT|nr:metallophosphatase [Labilibaculum filiforme]